MFDPATYAPGDPWTEKEFRIRAITAPNYGFVATAVDDVSPASYFESVQGRGGDRVVELSVRRSAGVGAFECELQRSHDDGVTWQTYKVYTGETEDTIEYHSMYKLRMKLNAIVGGDSVTFRLWQHI